MSGLVGDPRLVFSRHGCENDDVIKHINNISYHSVNVPDLASNLVFSAKHMKN